LKPNRHILTVGTRHPVRPVAPQVPLVKQQSRRARLGHQPPPAVALEELRTTVGRCDYLPGRALNAEMVRELLLRREGRGWPPMNPDYRIEISIVLTIKRSSIYNYALFFVKSGVRCYNYV
jgi:hypothetical protein